MFYQEKLEFINDAYRGYTKKRVMGEVATREKYWQDVAEFSNGNKIKIGVPGYKNSKSGLKDFAVCGSPRN